MVSTSVALFFLIFDETMLVLAETIVGGWHVYMYAYMSARTHIYKNIKAIAQQWQEQHFAIL